MLSPLPASGEERAEAAPRPDPRGAEGLRRDLERVVSAQDSTGWFLDDAEYRSMYPSVLQSVCRASPEARAEAEAALAVDSGRAGDPRELYRRAGKKLTAEVKEALRLSRELEMIHRANVGAMADCPFWTAAERGFDGRQSDAYRVTLSLETGGLLQVRSTASTWTYGGGGVGRVLLGYGLSPRVSVLGGFEFAGGAMLRPRDQESQFVVNYLPAIPVVLRLHDVGWHYDLELAGVTLFQADDARVSYGGRVGLGVGVSALRTRFFTPWAGIAVAYEHYVDSGGRPAAEFFRGGLRVGAVIDL